MLGTSKPSCEKKIGSNIIVLWIIYSFSAVVQRCCGVRGVRGVGDWCGGVGRVDGGRGHSRHSVVVSRVGQQLRLRRGRRRRLRARSRQRHSHQGEQGKLEIEKKMFHNVYLEPFQIFKVFYCYSNLPYYEQVYGLKLKTDLVKSTKVRSVFLSTFLNSDQIKRE